MNKGFQAIKSMICMLMILTLISCALFDPDHPHTTQPVETKNNDVPVTTTQPLENEQPELTDLPTRDPAEYDVDVSSFFFSLEVLQNIRDNLDDFVDLRAKKQTLLDKAQIYRDMTYDMLWSMVIGPELDRSMLVHSKAPCPNCGRTVVTTHWHIDPILSPWKLQCPHCEMFFPTNDFEAYYQSGLDKSGRFSTDLADSSLLINTQSAEKHERFGVDDGAGSVQNGMTYRFIQTYLVYGQWQQKVLDAIDTLSRAYVMTRDIEYAIRALIVLDRVADFFPEYDFYTQGFINEQKEQSHGFIGDAWQSAADVLDLAIAYDRMVQVIHMEPRLVEFLSQKAQLTGIENQKTTPKAIQENIEDRIFRTVLDHPEKIGEGTARADAAILIIQAILHAFESKEVAMEKAYDWVAQYTYMDGLAGSSGLIDYASEPKHLIGRVLGLFMQIEPDFSKNLFERVPKIVNTYAFYNDVHALGRYYPNIGESGRFGIGTGEYQATTHEFLLMYDLYEWTQDPDLLRAMYRANGMTLSGVFNEFAGVKDLMPRYRRAAQQIEEYGTTIERSSVRYDDWQIAFLRSGAPMYRREVYLHFGTHKTPYQHNDGLSIGLYYQDADMMPGFGRTNAAYQGSPIEVEKWNTDIHAHNTVAMNRMPQQETRGEITLWSLGDYVQAMTASAPDMYLGISKYERSIALIDISDQHAYVIDVFRVGDGEEAVYEKIQRSNIGIFEHEGLTLQPVERDEVYPDRVMMYDYMKVMEAEPGWHVAWRLSNPFLQMTYSVQPGLKMMDFTKDGLMHSAKSWLFPDEMSLMEDHEGYELDTFLVEKHAPLGESIAFVSLLEPFSRVSRIVKAQRLDLESIRAREVMDTHVAIEVHTSTGLIDVVIMCDQDMPDAYKDVSVDTDRGRIQTDAALVLIRWNSSNELIGIRASMGSYVRIDDKVYPIENTQELTHIDFE